jgi:hypothetical protein
MDHQLVFQPAPHSRAVSLAALLGLALLLMAAPAVVAALAIADKTLVSGAWGAARGALAVLTLVAPVHVLLILPLVALVAREREDL